jgi:hypothetical protein
MASRQGDPQGGPFTPPRRHAATPSALARVAAGALEKQRQFDEPSCSLNYGRRSVFVIGNVRGCSGPQENLDDVPSSGEEREMEGRVGPR